MVRALRALGVGVVAVLGVLPAASSQAARLQQPSHLTTTTYAVSGAPVRWIMVKPDIPIYTRMVTPHNSVTGTEIVQLALRYIGFPYTLTGNTPALGFSCIGFVSYVYQTLGIPLPDELGNARAYAPAVSLADAEPGDILWFGNTVWPGLSHTAIYLGNGRFVHAAWFNRGVITSSLRNDPVDGNYWIDHFLGVSRPWGGANANLEQLAIESIPTTVRGLPGAPALMVTVPQLNLRRWWSLHAPVKETVSRATPLDVLRRDGHWYQVMTPDGVRGWIATKSIAGHPLNTAAVQGTPTATARKATHHLKSHTVHTHRAHRTAHHVVHRRIARRVAAKRRSAQQIASSIVQSVEQQVLHPHAHGRVAVHHAGQTRHLRFGQAEPWIRLRMRGVVAARVSLRATPHAGAHVRKALRPGTHLTVLGYNGVWKRVKLASGRMGYVKASAVR
jgi:cell wall-associated NlpC family hydrolase/SH3-like domain-containing protein